MTEHTPPVGRSPRSSSSVTVSRDGRVVATADVATGPDGTARIALLTGHDQAAAVRSDLVDLVMDSPEVRGSESVHVVVPLGDSASISRLQDRTTGFDAHAAGASAVIEAEVSPAAAVDDDEEEPPAGR